MLSKISTSENLHLGAKTRENYMHKQVMTQNHECTSKCQYALLSVCV